MNENEIEKAAPSDVGNAAVAGVADAQSGNDGVETALSEWDAETEAEAAEGEQANDAAVSDRLDFSAAERAAIEQAAELNRQYRAELDRERDRQDFYNLTHSLAKEFPEIPIGEIEERLLGRFTRDPLFKKAAEARYTATDRNSLIPLSGAEKWKREINRFKEDLARASHRGYDADVTATREAVSFALRGGSRTPPPRQMPNLGKMSDAEFRRHAEQEWGFTPRLD